MSDDKWKLRERALYLLSGCTASAVIVCSFYPLDLIKTRLQIQSEALLTSKHDPNYYYGMVDCMLKMYKKEGILSFWKGILPPLVVHTPRRGLKFYIFEEFKKYSLDNKDQSQLKIYLLGGICTGLVEGILMTPFEVIKIMLQSNRSVVQKTPSSWKMTQIVISTGGYGLNGLFKGLTATILEMTIYNIFFFGTYYSVQDILATHENRKLKFSEKILLGMASSSFATVFSIPLDVAKSRIQSPASASNGKKYKWTFPTMRTIYKEEGLTALTKGLFVKILRHAPAGSIMLIMNDYLNQYFLS
ncbi:hypothetical protein WA026_015598 [Henosepilachna vigintioctopunctata]|uniref:Mitochondrial 2-oxodicarboxylate carrier n=1 Tax=Henosepilachna vigintioctopunctata TaxID=420089 RepID=A0AAW1VH09_9CUCU